LKIRQLILIILSFTIINLIPFKSIFSQYSWFIQNSAIYVPYVNGIDFTDSNTGYAAGSYGKIYKTTDSGNNWSNVFSYGSNAFFWSTSFANSETGWAAGSGGIIIKTTNGAESWSLQNSNTASDIINIYFINSLSGWAAAHNGKIIKTTDGGNNWSVMNTGTTANFFSVFFINSETGWASGDDGLYKSTDGGYNWQNIYALTSLYTVKFVNINTGWIGARFGGIYKTTNGGESWSQQTSGTDASINFYKFINENTGWAVGDFKIILKTTNGGNSWNSLQSGIINFNSNFRCIDLSDETGMNCHIAGSNGVILNSSDGGITWQNNGVSPVTDKYLYSADFINSNTGWVAGGSGTVIKTTNGGNRWFGQYTNNPNYIININFIDENTGWAIGHVGTVLKSVNGGQNWTSQNAGTVSNLFSSSFINSSTGWISGDNGVMKTTDGGQNWIQQLNAPSVYVVYFINENTGWTGGQLGKIYKTINSGTTWQLQQNPTDAPFNSIQFINENTGWMTGDFSKIIKTTNGGLNWIEQNSGLTSRADLRKIDFYDPEGQTGWISGRSGVMLRTTNSGVNWIKVTMPLPDEDYNSVVFTSPLVGYTVGSYGIVLKTTNGGTTFTNENNYSVPDKFVLYQNYPNPFNPGTKIKFDIPVNNNFNFGNVKLLIYNSLGKEVRVLINEYLSPGSYEKEFDGSGLSSGIYYYKLEAGNYTESRKMLLVK
jgi:photosystem II stability/assembly factor-like uncharacterized protein